MGSQSRRPGCRISRWRACGRWWRGGGVWLVLAFSCMTECCKVLVLGRCISWGQKHKYEAFCLLCLEFYGAVTAQEEPWRAWVFGGWASWDGSPSWGAWQFTLNRGGERAGRASRALGLGATPVLPGPAGELGPAPGGRHSVWLPISKARSTVVPTFPVVIHLQPVQKY